MVILGVILLIIGLIANIQILYDQTRAATVDLPTPPLRLATARK